MLYSRNLRGVLVALMCSTALLTGCQLGGRYPLAPGVPSGWNDCRYDVLIHQTWHADQDWAQQVAWRESRCTPDARNGSGSEGIFQLLGHDDLLRAACPKQSPSSSWADPYCNIEAGWLLYLRAGRSPWRL